MLGTIAKKMRMLGFDSKYFGISNDEDLLFLAKREGRALVTKDRKLASNAKKLDITTAMLGSDTETEQLVEIAHELGLKKYEYDADGARCPLCNGTLQQIEKRMVFDMIPPRISEGVDRFWICQHCYHLYWKGTHIRNLEKMIQEINGRL